MSENVMLGYFCSPLVPLPSLWEYVQASLQEKNGAAIGQQSCLSQGPRLVSLGKFSWPPSKTQCWHRWRVRTTKPKAIEQDYKAKSQNQELILMCFIANHWGFVKFFIMQHHCCNKWLTCHAPYFLYNPLPSNLWLIFKCLSSESTTKTYIN